jgi:hypothetical protein
MTDTQRIDRLEKAVERLCSILTRHVDGAGWNIELIRQYVNGDLEPKEVVQQTTPLSNLEDDPNSASGKRIRR